MNAKSASMLLSILFCSLLSLIFIGIDIPLPSSVLFLLILTNAIFAFLSIFMQNAIIGLFEYNYHTEKKNILSLFNKYTTLAFFGLNYFAQLALNRLPFLFNKLFSLIFFAFLFIQWILIMHIYNG